jgi:hypothetical protein
MPWCDTCSRYWTNPSLAPDGSCPTCGRTIGEAHVEPRAPWHFKLMVAALVVYLVWRAIDLVGQLL